MSFDLNSATILKLLTQIFTSLIWTFKSCQNPNVVLPTATTFACKAKGYNSFRGDSTPSVLFLQPGYNL
jgi:hypothetical protein